MFSRVGNTLQDAAEPFVFRNLLAFPVCDGKASTVAQDVEYPSVVRYLPVFPVCSGNVLTVAHDTAFPSVERYFPPFPVCTGANVLIVGLLDRSLYDPLDATTARPRLLFAAVTLVKSEKLLDARSAPLRLA